MYDHNKEMVKAARREAAPLINGKLVRIAEEAGYVGLVFRCTDGAERVAWVLRDPEGNGPGWLEVDRSAM